MNKEVQKVINRFKRVRPHNLEQILRKCVSNLSYIGRGSFRAVYKIDKLPLVVKIATPNYEDETLYSECLDHSDNEIDAIKRVKRYKKYAAIRKYLPEVYYYNKHGIVLMKEYPSTVSWLKSKKCEEARKALEDAFDKDFDTYKNFTIDKGQPILLDWGILGQKTEWV